MRTRLLRRASIGALALTLFGGTAALADQILADADALATGIGSHGDAVAVTQARGNTTAYDLSAAIKNTGQSSNDVLGAPADSVTVTVQRSGAWLSADKGSPASFTFTAYDASQAGTLRVTVPCSAAKDDVETMTVVLSATAFNGKTLSPNTKTLTYTITAGDAESGKCVTNTAPSAPGAPVASENPTQGAFTLSWAASTDTQNDAFTYTLEGQDADDAGFTTIASGLTTNSHTFATDTPGEGTWTYRVKAVETSTSALSSGYSAVSTAVVVDRTDPNAPTAAADRDREYSDGTTNWWKDRVTVSFGWNGDPALDDTSAGSGQGTTTVSETITSSGAFISTGTATDRALNESDPISFNGSIDTLAPEVTCPASSVVLGTTGATIPWSATDSGDSSGLVAGSGTIAVDSASVAASRTVTVPEGTAEDNVGHKSPETTCTYQVRYAWDGFLQPINDTAHDQGAMSVFKVGSTVPVKFQVKDATGAVVTATVAPGWAGAARASSCTLVGSDLEAAATVSATTGTTFRWDATSQQYIYNWSTKGLAANTCWDIGVTLDDGTTQTVTIGLRK